MELTGHLCGGGVGLTAGQLDHGGVGDTFTYHTIQEHGDQAGDALVQLEYYVKLFVV